MTLKEFFNRYGLTISIVVVFALIVAALPGNKPAGTVAAGDNTSGSRTNGALGTNGDSGTDFNTGETIPGGGSVSGPGGNGSTGGGGGSSNAPSGGSTVAFGKGKDCTAKGQQIGFSAYMPPCVQWTGTNNGGATARGVSGNSITVVSWLGQEDPATRQALTAASLNDQPETVTRAYNALFKYSNAYYQTYGREVKIVQMNASGPSADDSAMKADAVKIADELHAFAVFVGNALAPIPTSLARELAQRQVICICTTSLSSAFYNELPNTIFSSLPTIDEYAQQSAEYVGKKLKGKTAEFAGVDQRSKQRVFCLMYLNGAGTTVDPEGERMRKIFDAEFAKYGVQFKKEIAYLYDPGSNQNDVTAMMTSFKNAGCTTLVPLVDPIEPILITKEATKQAYFPEWLIVGTGLSDTTTIARFYDQQQWAHAFGISPLWVTWDRVQNSPGYLEYHDAVPGSRDGDEGTLINIYRASVQTIFRGIHMAGPTLNNQTFAAGQYAIPALGGTPANPLVFMTKQYPTEVKDFSEIWYDPNQVGPDERSKQGPGMITRADGGKRYRVGEWKTGNPSRTNPAYVTPQQGNGSPPPNPDRYNHKCLSCNF
jgi:hypothetical protein